MITLFDLLQILLTIGGTVAGAASGCSMFGVVGFVGGAIAGGYLGAKIGGLPSRLAQWHHRKKLAPFSIEELERHLTDFDWQSESPNYLFAELIARGADVEKHLPLVLEWLCSEDLMKRAFGYAALRTAFPETALQLGGFNEYQPAEKCRGKVDRLRRKWVESSGTNAENAEKGRRPKA